jgi:hypothetical protein
VVTGLTYYLTSDLEMLTINFSLIRGPEKWWRRVITYTSITNSYSHGIILLEAWSGPDTIPSASLDPS